VCDLKTAFAKQLYAGTEVAKRPELWSAWSRAASISLWNIFEWQVRIRHAEAKKPWFTGDDWLTAKVPRPLGLYNVKFEEDY
jgi:hypothetical protein